MSQGRKTKFELIDENHRLRAQVAQLEDRLDHLAEHGAVAKALQQWQGLQQEVMSVVSDVVLIADDAGRLTYVSPNAHYIFSHTSEEILAQGRLHSLLPGDLFELDVLEQRGEIANIECRIRDAVGRARSLLVTVRRVDRDGGTILYACRDVSERLKVELEYELLQLTLERRVEEQTQVLRESKEQFRRLVEGLRDEYLFYATDPHGIVTYVSPSVHTILGYTPNQLIGHNWRKFVDGDHALFPELEKLEQMRFAGIATPLFRAPCLHAAGGVRVLEFRDAPVRDPDGRVIASEGIGKDITQRLQAEEALHQAREELERRVRERTAELNNMYERLRDSEHRYRSVVEDQLEYIVRWHGDGIRTFVNKAYCRARGASDEELLGQSFMPFVAEKDREMLRSRIAKLTVDDPVVFYEHQVIRPDGSTAWEQWSSRALFDQDGKLIEYQSVGSDVTERRRRQQQAQERAMATAQLRALSERELDVMHLVVTGDANKVIARKLGLSIKTIEKHRSSLMKKLHARSVPELVRLALMVEEPSET
jgi:PAS domain S-box-containing protein